MNTDAIAVCIGILAMLGFLSVICFVIFIGALLLDRWTTRLIPPENETKPSIFNAFEEAKKRNERHNRERASYSKRGV